MDNQMPVQGDVGGSRKLGAIIAALAVLAVVALVAFYVFQPGPEAVTEEPRAEEVIAPVGGVDVTEGIGEVSALTVSIVNFKFAPETITVKAGESVTWKNNEANVPHSIVLDDGSYKSAAVFAGEEEVRRFPVAGTYPYHCGIHPSMKGVVVVE